MRVTNFIRRANFLESFILATLTIHGIQLGYMVFVLKSADINSFLNIQSLFQPAVYGMTYAIIKKPIRGIVGWLKDEISVWYNVRKFMLSDPGNAFFCDSFYRDFSISKTCKLKKWNSRYANYLSSEIYGQRIIAYKGNDFIAVRDNAADYIKKRIVGDFDVLEVKESVLKNIAQSRIKKKEKVVIFLL